MLDHRPVRAISHLFVGAGLLVGLVGAGCSGRPSSQEGQALFLQICARCHGDDGKGNPVERARLGVPDMTDPVFHARLNDDQMKHAIRKGSTSGKMPPFGTSFSEQQLEAIVAHVRTLKR
jgi:mono/diheme cytochrome c family protein